MTLNTEPIRNTMASLASVRAHGISRPRRLSILKQPQSQTPQESLLITHTKAPSSRPLAVPNVTTLLRRTLAAGAKAKPFASASGSSLALKSASGDNRTDYQVHRLRCVSPRNVPNRKPSHVSNNAGADADEPEVVGYCPTEEPVPMGHKPVVHRTTPANKSDPCTPDSGMHSVEQGARNEKSRRATLLSHGARERPSQLPRPGTLAGRNTFVADQHYGKCTPYKTKMASRIPCYPTELRTTLNRSCASSREGNTASHATETQLRSQAKAKGTSENCNLNAKSASGSNEQCDTWRSIGRKENAPLSNAAQNTQLKHPHKPMTSDLQASMLAGLLHQETVWSTSVTQQRQNYEERNVATARMRDIHNSETKLAPWSLRDARFCNPATGKEPQGVMTDEFSRSQKELSESDHTQPQTDATAPVYWGETFNISDSETAETLPADYRHPSLQTAQLENIWEPDVTDAYNAPGYPNPESLHCSLQTHRLVEKQRNGHLLQFVNPYSESHANSSLETFASALTLHEPLDEEQSTAHRSGEARIRAFALQTSRGVNEDRSRESTPWLAGNQPAPNMETRTRMQWTSRSVSQGSPEPFRSDDQHLFETRENQRAHYESYSSRNHLMFHPPDDGRELPKPFAVGYGAPYTQGPVYRGFSANSTRDKETTDLWSAVEHGVGQSVQMEGPGESVKNSMSQCGLDRKRFSIVADPKQRAAFSQSVVIKSSRVDSSCGYSNSDGSNLTAGWSGLSPGSQTSFYHLDASPGTAVPPDKRNDSCCFSQANSARGVPPTIFGVTSQSRRNDHVQGSAAHDAHPSESGPYPASSSASVVSLYPAPASAQEPIHADLLPRDRQTGFEQCRESLKVVLQKMEDLPRLLFDCDVYNFYLQFIHFPTRENPIEPITTDPIGPFFSRGSSNGLTVCCDMMNSVVEIPYVAKTELRIAVLQEYRDQKDFVGRARVILPGLPRHAADAGIVTLLDAPGGIPIEGAAGCIRGKISLTVLCRVNLAVPSHSAQKYSSGRASQTKERLLPPGDMHRLDAYSNQMCGQGDPMWASGGSAPTSALWSFLESMFSDPLAASHENYEQEKMETPMSEHLHRMRRRSLRQGRTERRPFSVFCMDIPDQLCGG